MYLLDTHVLLWWLSSPEVLDKAVQKLLASSESPIYLSAAVMWEIRVKESLKKLGLPKDFASELNRQGFDELPIRVRHADAAADLPMIHKDPFDRMLIAQAKTEGLTIVTRDETIPKYKLKILKA